MQNAKRLVKESGCNRTSQNFTLSIIRDFRYSKFRGRSLKKEKCGTHATRVAVSMNLSHLLGI